MPHPARQCLTTTVPILDEPSSYTVASKFPNWYAAMAHEFVALTHNHSWTLVPLVPSSNTFGCSWEYRTKTKADGSLQQRKARIVAKDFHQQSGLDYHETFSPEIKPSTIRLIMSIVVSRRWALHLLDIENAFLHGTLMDDVFMQ
ncbi:uncharacterized mitochondrial protein AtMg00820-like [Malania oleifera]|uniref:uncharacterized mitochondrial protein AtMg00820-like n=1 Tax=Malania oleifera TaxID=397392 RepID=UPI0025AE2C61|nr:uncharacterized mitochondrial protein AtMg00820-like [Malania oleifera]